MKWKLDNAVRTSAGKVASGCAGEGPAVVLAHGWPWSSYSWHRVIPEMSKAHRVYWYDMPGYGQSEKYAQQKTSLDIRGQVFYEMLDYWKLDQPSVIAHDFGGAVTLRAHLLHGCDYDHYILMNVVAMRPWGSEFFEHVGRHVEAFLGLPPHIHKAVVTAYIQGAIVAGIDADDLAELIAPWLTDTGKESFYRQFAQTDEKYTAEVEPQFGNLRCSTNIIWGEADPWIPIARGRELHKLMPTASFETIAGVGHLPQLEAPQDVLEHLSVKLSN